MADQQPKIYPRKSPDTQMDFFKKLLEAQFKQNIVENDEDLNRQKIKQQLEQASQTHKDFLDERRKDRELKEKVANRIFRLLITETIVVFGVLILQGFKRLGFNINDTTLNIFLPATIIQISTMAVIITRSLFPTVKKDLEKH